MSTLSINIVGAGIFGATAAWVLAKRGYQVHLFDPGPLPHPKASSTDISKLIRMDYGDDKFFTELMEASFSGWHKWNQLFQRPLYHEVGALMLTTEPMQAGSFEADSYETIKNRGHELSRLNQGELASRFPKWNADKYLDGYFNPLAGWAESGAVLKEIIGFAQQAGVELHEGHACTGFIEDDSRVRGIITNDNTEWKSDRVIVAAGSWTPKFFPELADEMWPVALPIMHFAPKNSTSFAPPSFVPWAADISRTGWYGFCANADGILKIANHGPGTRIDPQQDSRELPASAEANARKFFEESIPSAASAEFVGGKLCLYCDTYDGDFFIDHHPDRKGLLIATGGSGHGFKFSPMLGDIIADVLEEKPNRFATRFAWRRRSERKTEQARFDG